MTNDGGPNYPDAPERPTTGKREGVVIYSWGLCAMSVCVPKGMTDEEIERSANLQMPTGIASRWKCSDEPFKDGPNPSPCNTDPEREHRLLNC